MTMWKGVTCRAKPINMQLFVNKTCQCYVQNLFSLLPRAQKIYSCSLKGLALKSNFCIMNLIEIVGAWLNVYHGGKGPKEQSQM